MPLTKPRPVGLGDLPGQLPGLLAVAGVGDGGSPLSPPAVAREKTMLQEILNALKGNDLLGEMFGQLGRMLRAGRWMFQESSRVLMRVADWQGVADELYTRDREINRIQQDVREKVIAHLAVGNQTDLGACLVLISVVKDAERIGDYCKNIFEVGKFYTREYAHPQYAKPLEDVRAGVEALFERAEKAFLEGDRALARAVQDRVGALTRTCDVLIRQLLRTHNEMPADEAVAYVLLSRFYKRVAAHLGNIASAVVSPVPLIDYRDERRLENA
jgi:phosphate transport system protein